MTVFVDTNVLVYAFDLHDTRKHELARQVLVDRWSAGDGALSTQVLQEFYAVATRKLRTPLAHSVARRIVADYAEWACVEATPQLIVSASVLCERHDVNFWDALVIGAAHLAGARRLLSEDLQDGRRFGPVEVQNPFR